MKCKECRDRLFSHARESVRSPQLGPVTGKLPTEVQTHISTCSACATLAAALQLSLSQNQFTSEIPAGLTDRISTSVMNAVFEEESAGEPAADLQDRSTRFLRSRRPVLGRVASLAAAAVLLVASSVGLTLFVTDRRVPGGAPAAQQAASQITVHLSLQAPDAESVAVVGDWNDWNPEAQPLQDSDGDGVWELSIKIDRGGEYKYQFLVNGEKWIPDPKAPLKVKDGFGGTNSILDI